MMGTRSGDIDAGLVLRMIGGETGIPPQDVDRILNNDSGLLGVSGVSNDVREVSAHAAAGDFRCILALKMYAYRVKKYIGAYAAAMSGLDLLVFTAGVGENSAEIRTSVCDGLEFLGIVIDPELNSAAQGIESDISAEGTPVHVLVVPTNEEAIIVEDTLTVVGSLETRA